ncbi:MAG TPA: TrmJ/YjtD family RNA methyltransferase [Pseudolabrys sp.]|nr:TrmJ/YjtD family RNA methyltransferase [Pseudolabrys sp.]
MPGAGTDNTREWVDVAGPVIVLVGPQMGENIGAAARAMANFGLSRLRLVKPVQGWPNHKAHMMAAGADHILESAQVFETAADAVADCHFVLATTARTHDQAKPVVGADAAARLIAPHVGGGETVAIMFGRERNGLENDEVALADATVTLPVNPAFASLNLAQAVVIVTYEWFKLAREGRLPFAAPDRSPLAPKQQLQSFFDMLEQELERVEFFRPAEKRETMAINLRNIFNRMNATQQDIRTLHGVVNAIVTGRKGPARGGVLDSEQALQLRALIAEGKPGDGGPVRGLARLLRRNPTDIERALWHALVNDKRFAGKGFKRQTPVGQQVCDFVSFPLRLVVDVVPESEDAVSAGKRAVRRTWLEERNYRVVTVSASDVSADIAAALDRIAEAIPGEPQV